ncbi:BTAD domain-containing putative transcriptional regulator [Nonomuraea sp. NPDC050643]|uniref:AfsR/SARP family transcriptional regulator n=1 Tax=Nonomuraea sp. NPDC050643 TaxID=3155660 RepID=UPI0033D794FB
MVLEGHPRVRFSVLGPVECRSESGRLVLTGKQGALLTILLLNANRVVSTQRLAEALWGEPLPSSPASRVRTLISDLRKTCATAEIHTQRPGYVIRLPSDRLDLTAFLDHVTRAREAGDPETALAHYDRALSLWRGTPLTGVDGSFVQAEAARLEELRLGAVEERSSAMLALGRYAEAITDLTAIITDHPLREPAHERLMLALYRGGRRTEALAIYRGLRERTIEELGLEPEGELQRLHQRILTADNTLKPATTPLDPARTAAPNPTRATPPNSAPGPLDPTASTALEPSAGATAVPPLRPAHTALTLGEGARAPHPVPIPRQLPAPPPRFAGRGPERARLDHLRTTAGMPIAAVGGAGGMGKTWLALYWAHDNIDLFPDGQLYVNLHGFDPNTGPLPAHVALRHFLGSLGVPAAAIPAGQEAQAGLFRSLVADLRLLVVLDNARDVAQIEPLLPGSAGCTVLVTSRNSLAGLNATHGATLITLAPLTPAETRHLLRSHLGPARLDEDPGSVAVLVEHSGGLPLAIGVLTARAAMHPDFPLSVLAEQLRSPSTRLDALTTGGDLNTDLRAAFTSSYEALDAPTARLFALLGLAPWPDCGLSSAAALAGLPTSRARVLLHDLETANLVGQHRPGRYRTHDLVRLYAAERAHADLPVHDRSEALARLFDAYARTARAGDRLLFPSRPFAGRMSPESARKEFEDVEAVWAWFEAEQPALIAAQRLAVQLHMDAAAWRLAWAMDTFHMRRCLHAQRLEIWRTALAAAERMGDLNARAFAHWYLGYAHAQATGPCEDDEDLEHLHRAAELFEQDGDRAGQAHTSHTLGYAWLMRGAADRALPHVEHALRLQRELGDAAWEANALGAAGWCHVQLGHHAKARRYCEQALALFRTHEDENGESATLDSLGYIAHLAGRHDEALRYYARCLTIREKLGNVYQGADTLTRIGDVHHDTGDSTAARATWRQARELYQRQHRTAEADALWRKITRSAGPPSGATGPADPSAPAAR